MNINQLKLLDVIVHTKSFNKAAEKCFVSTSTLMRQVNAMEAEIGFAIFGRSASGVSLTQQGEIFYQLTLGIPQLYESAVSSARRLGQEKRLVRIILFSYTRNYVTRACESLKAQDGEYDCSFVSCRLRENVSALLDRRADIAPLTEIQEPDERLFVLPIFRCCNTVIVPETSPFAQAGGVRMEELDGKTILISAKTAESRNFRTVKRLLEQKCPRSVFLEYQHPDQADALCQMNGYPILSLGFLELNEGFRHVRLLDAPTVQIGAACRKEDQKRYRALIERFRDTLIYSGDFNEYWEREQGE